MPLPQTTPFVKLQQRRTWRTVQLSHITQNSSCSHIITSLPPSPPSAPFPRRLNLQSIIRNSICLCLTCDCKMSEPTGKHDCSKISCFFQAGNAQQQASINQTFTKRSRQMQEFNSKLSSPFSATFLTTSASRGAVLPTPEPFAGDLNTKGSFIIAP